MFCTPMGLKTCLDSKCNDNVQFQIEKQEINCRRSLRVPQTRKNLIISRCCFAADGKEMYKDL